MRYGTICSGIETTSIAWRPLGWRPVYFAEHDPSKKKKAQFAAAVLSHHYPEVPNLGDITKLNYEKQNIDLIFGSTPCQGFSMAGNRGGMDDPRSKLSLQFIRFIEIERPRWVVWENVPGVLSSNKGRDFKEFATKVAELGYYCSWRVFDLQFFGIPQQRRRVFFVGYYGDWRPPAAVLFERKVLQDGPQKSQRKNKASTSAIDIDTDQTSPFTFQRRFFRNNRGGPATIVPTLTGVDAGNTSDSRPLVFDTRAMRHNDRSNINDVVPTFVAHHTPVCVTQGGLVRFFTPIEYERLMGIPDNYTNIIFNGWPAAKSNRYKAIGNAIGVPKLEWLGRRIDIVNKLITNKKTTS